MISLALKLILSSWGYCPGTGREPRGDAESIASDTGKSSRVDAKPPLQSTGWKSPERI
jgi:hypothetical protein